VSGQRNERRTYDIRIHGEKNGNSDAVVNQKEFLFICKGVSKKLPCYSISHVDERQFTNPGTFFELFDRIEWSEAKNMTRNADGSWDCVFSVAVADDRVRGCDINDIVIRAGKVGLRELGTFALVQSRSKGRLPLGKQICVLSTKLDPQVDVQFRDIHGYNNARFRRSLDFDAIMEHNALNPSNAPIAKLLPPVDESIDATSEGK